MPRTVDRRQYGERRPRGAEDEVLDDGVPLPTFPMLGIRQLPGKRPRRNFGARPVFARDARWWPSVRVAAAAVGCDPSTLCRVMRQRAVYNGVEPSYKPFPGVTYVGR